MAICCREGTTTAYSVGDKSTPKDANYPVSKIRKPVVVVVVVVVGSYKPNAFGLCYMHGNVLEWCEDRYGNYPDEAITDPKGPATGEHRVLRGGSFLDFGSGARSSDRGGLTASLRYDSIGFRLARTP